MELGGKYMHIWGFRPVPTGLFWTVAMLIPGLLLGVHGIKYAGREGEERVKYAKSCMPKLYCGLYFTLAGLAILGKIYTHYFYKVHQYNHDGTLYSWEKSYNWRIYYFVVMQFAVSMVLSLTYSISASKTRKAAKQAEKDVPAATSADLLGNETVDHEACRLPKVSVHAKIPQGEPIIHPQAMFYPTNSMI